MNVNANFDITPVVLELFKIQALMHSYVDVTLTDAQKIEFDAHFAKNYKNVILDFIEQFPHIMKDADELKKHLGAIFYPIFST